MSQTKPLKFGTSGLRGLVTDMTDQECFINTLGFLRYLTAQGSIRPGDPVLLGGDLRASSPRIMTAVAAAIRQAGGRLEYAGLVPTPALAYYALQRHWASIMVTGSHIPADRNGIKFTKPDGEVLKTDEPGILAAVAQVREMDFSACWDEQGQLMPAERRDLPQADSRVVQEYIERYVRSFPAEVLHGRKIVVDQHSAVGRDVLVEILRRLGADVVPVHRTDHFVALDTENVTAGDLAAFQALAQAHRPFAIVSTDGDSDRPFVLDGKGNFYRGDVVGAVVADYLGADFAAVPVSASDALDVYLPAHGIRRQETRIGSPYVVSAMQQAAQQGSRQVTGWEVNGGFLLGSSVQLPGGKLALQPLPTRDAMLPILAVLSQAAVKGSVEQVFADLQPRFTQAGLIDDFPIEQSQQLMRILMAGLQSAVKIDFSAQGAQVFDAAGRIRDLSLPVLQSSMAWQEDRPLEQIFALKQALETEYFLKTGPYAEVKTMNVIDGLKIIFANQDVVHLRPSGNAPQMRVYAIANSQTRADQIVAECISANGIIQRMLKAVCKL